MAIYYNSFEYILLLWMGKKIGYKARP